MGVVTHVGPGVSHVAPGDHVVSVLPLQGTWRHVGVFNAAAWRPVPKELPVSAAARAAINPPTAIHLLNRFVELREGDVLVQNGANGTVGQCVVQMARARGIRTVNVVRA